jgi:F-type H+-transporting ATPase subunit b
MRKTLRSPRFGKWLLLLVLVFPVLLHRSASASQATPSSAQSQSSAGNQPQTLGADVAQESREAAGEDDEAKFKQSASVKLLARVTNMDLEHAYWLGMGINFAVILVVILWFGRKMLPGMFRARTTLIQKSMAEAQKASEDANRRLADIETRLSRLDSEIAGIRTAAEKEAAEEEQRIRLAAEEDARKIREAAELEIVAAGKAARRALTAYAADLAVALAAKQLHVDAETDRVLVRNFSQQLSSSNPKSSGKDSQ